MKSMRRYFVLVAMCLATLPLGGCFLLLAGAGAGAGGYYLHGQSKSTESMSLDQAYVATKQAFANLEMEVTESEKDAIQARVKADAAGDKTVTVKLRSESDDLTEFVVTILPIPDRSLADRVMSEIRSARSSLKSITGS